MRPNATLEYIIVYSVTRRRPRHDRRMQAGDQWVADVLHFGALFGLTRERASQIEKKRLDVARQAVVVTCAASISPPARTHAPATGRLSRVRGCARRIGS